MKDSEIRNGAVIRSIYTGTVRTIVDHDLEWVTCTADEPEAIDGLIIISRDLILNYWELERRKHGKLHG